MFYLKIKINKVKNLMPQKLAEFSLINYIFVKIKKNRNLLLCDSQSNIEDSLHLISEICSLLNASHYQPLPYVS